MGLPLHAAVIPACFWHSEYAPRYVSFLISLMVQWKVAFQGQKKRPITLLFSEPVCR